MSVSIVAKSEMFIYVVPENKIRKMFRGFEAILPLMLTDSRASHMQMAYGHLSHARYMSLAAQGRFVLFVQCAEGLTGEKTAGQKSNQVGKSCVQISAQ